MRPRLEIRTSLSQAAQQLQPLLGEVTYKDLAVHAKVGFQAARNTVYNMVNAGELEPVGTKRDPGSKRPLRTYRPGGRRVDPAQTLASTMRGWVTAY